MYMSIFLLLRSVDMNYRIYCRRICRRRFTAVSGIFLQIEVLFATLIIGSFMKGEQADFCISEVQKYGKVQRSTRKYDEVQEVQEVQRSTGKYKEVRKRTRSTKAYKKYGEMYVST